MGDDPGEQPVGDGNRTVGDRLGPCFPDGKCKEGLVCRDGEICLAPDEPKPTTDAGGSQTDGGGDGSAAPDSGNDSDGACTVSPLTAKPGPGCGDTSCNLGEACCGAGAALRCGPDDAANCPDTTPKWACDTNSDCGNLACCFVGKEGTGSTCTSALSEATSSCVPPNTCQTTGGTPGCTDDTQCSGKKCRPTEMKTKLGFSTIVMACR